MKDPLDRLIVSGEELDRELLASVLAGLVMVEKETGEIRFTRDALQLPQRLQILLFLLGRKAAKASRLVEEEAIGPSGMEEKLGVKGGPLRGQLFQLKKNRLVQAQGGKYTVPSYAIEAVKEIIEVQRGKGA